MAEGGQSTAPPYVIPRSYCDKSFRLNELATTACLDGAATPKFVQC
jgi:hypothetical protein